MGRLPELAELGFILTTYTGSVHLYVRFPNWHPQARVAASFEPYLTRCGRFASPGSSTADRHQFIGSFHDAQLCRACYRTLDPADQHLAFEHDQPATAA
ncbi:hypothetical protein ADK52_25385 [Streptomyces sp. WM6372]|uniref:hypothetical protein n=1 Tax=Streptomyces sp. WM6372 TaxID=1415555 RepID=UPI0006AD921A|nr:hypothetical protein [Streptomyces sp. WM6372]KOU20927.1 hypothetical protein ADK52_25385 [Streptomyces sp. WM6372]